MDSVSDHTKSFEKSPLYSIPNFDKEYSTRDLVSQGTTKSFGDDSVQIIEGDDNVEIRGEANKDEIFFPEGGLAAWLVVFGSWCALFSSLGIMNTMGSFQLYISTNQLVIYNTDDVSWIFSLYAFLSFGVSLFVGPIFDNYGPRWLIMLGGALVTVSMATIGVSQKYWHFILSFSVAGGVGTALLFAPSIAIVGHYFDKRRGHATGIAVTGGAVGGVVLPLLLQSLISQISWAWATRAVSLICFVLWMLANACIRGRLRAKKVSSWPDPKILRHAAFSVTVAGIFLVELALFIPLTYISSYCISKGFTPEFSYQILPILNAGSVFGRWLPGYFADKFGRYNMAIASISLTIISVVGIWLPVGNTKPGIIVFAILFGFSSGTNIGLTPVCISQLCPIERYGTYYATCFSIASAGCLIGVPIAGKILDFSNGSYNGLIMFVGFCYGGGWLGFTGARIIATGWKFEAIY